jgi:hypothetical protein
MVTQVLCGLTTVLLFLYYVRQNKKRNNNSDSDNEDAFMTPEAWVRMTDRENKKFRYTY